MACAPSPLRSAGLPAGGRRPVGSFPSAVGDGGSRAAPLFPTTQWLHPPSQRPQPPPSQPTRTNLPTSRTHITRPPRASHPENRGDTVHLDIKPAIPSRNTNKDSRRRILREVTPVHLVNSWTRPPQRAIRKPTPAPLLHFRALSARLRKF